MRIEEIKALMSHMKSTDLTYFEYEGQGIKVKMGVEQSAIVPLAGQRIIEPVGTSLYTGTSELSEESASLSSVVEVSNEEIKAPIVGVFYAAASPDKANFVEVGDTVKEGDVLCIVESMKVMNEITAPKNCKITKILCKNEEIVEYGQPLFEIEVI